MGRTLEGSRSEPASEEMAPESWRGTDPAEGPPTETGGTSDAFGLVGLGERPKELSFWKLGIGLRSASESTLWMGFTSAGGASTSSAGFSPPFLAPGIVRTGVGPLAGEDPVVACARSPGATSVHRM